MKRSHRLGFALAIVAATTITATACGGGYGSTDATGQVPTTLTVVSGAGQSAPTSVALSSPFVVKIVDQNGFAIFNATVTWTIASGGGSLSSTTSTTDVNGQASTTYTAGTTAGTSTITAAIGTLTASFTVPVAARAPSILRIVGGNAQSGLVSSPLALPLSVLVLDQTSTPVAGVTVTWAIAAGGGSLSAATSTTDANGGATVKYTSGATPGTATITTTVSGLTPVTFTATISSSP